MNILQEQTSIKILRPEEFVKIPEPRVFYARHRATEWVEPGDVLKLSFYF